MGLGYAAGHLALLGRPAFPRFVGVQQGILYAALVATAVGLFEVAAGRGLRLLRVLGRVGLAVALPWFLLAFRRAHAWQGAAGIAWTALLAAAVLGAGLARDDLARRAPGPLVPLFLSVECALAALAQHLSRSASLAQLTGALAVPLAAAALVAWRRPGFTLVPGALTPYAAIGAGLLLAGVFASDLPAASAWLLAAGPLAPWLAVRISGRISDRSRTLWIGLGLFAAAGLLAVLLAIPDAASP